MKRSKLEEFLGQRVSITLFDGDILRGKLHKTGEKLFTNDPNLFLPKNYYFLTGGNGKQTCSCLFRCSHVVKIKQI